MSLKLLGGLAVAAGLALGTAPALAAGLSICVVHNNADHPSITALVAGMNDESAIYGAKAYGLFDACLGQRCAEAAGCIGTTVVSNEPLITCEQYLGLDATAGDQ